MPLSHITENGKAEVCRSLILQEQIFGFASKMSICDRATLHAMQRFEKAHVGSTNSHLGAACGDQDYD
jgi:hypothetical protein